MKEVITWWYWAKAKDYEIFLEYVRNRYAYKEDPLCCLFIVVGFPREFLEKYAETENSELGFLEYRVPIYSQIYRIPLCLDNPFKPWWAADPSTKSLQKKNVLNAVGNDISLSSILRQCFDPKGHRVFHPYRKKCPFRIIKFLQGRCFKNKNEMA